MLSMRRFMPLLITQILGAFNDNLFKIAAQILILFGIAAAGGTDGPIMVTIGGAVFILPFFLFSALGGQLADKFEKVCVLRCLKLAEIAIMGLAAVGLVTEHVPTLFAALFLMGLQSAIFGPAKSALMPEALRQDELIAGNALMEAGVYLAILLGTLAGGVLIAMGQGPYWVAGVAIAVGVIGYGASLAIPRSQPRRPTLKIDFNLLRATGTVLRYAAADRTVLVATLVIAWFQVVGATFVTQFPSFAQTVLGASEQVVTLFLTVFAIGVGVGSILTQRLLNDEISGRMAPIAGVVITLFVVDLYRTASGVVVGDGPLMTVGAFVNTTAGWHVLADLFFIAAAGGVFVVPFYAMVQDRTRETRRSRVMAAGSVANAAGMLAAFGVAAGLLQVGFSAADIYLVAGLANLAVAVALAVRFRREVARMVLVPLVRLVFRLRVRGGEHLLNAPAAAIIVPNHVSYLDGLILGAVLPGNPLFAVNAFVARRWWARPILALVDTVEIDPTRPMATKSLIKAVREGRRCVIFPEGRLTRTGKIMKIYDGPGVVAAKTGAPVIPVHLDGVERLPWTQIRFRRRTRWFPRIAVTVLPPRLLAVPVGGPRAEVRRRLALQLYDALSEAQFRGKDVPATLFAALLQARRDHGGDTVILNDAAQRQSFTYDRLVTAALALGSRLAAGTGRGERVGMMLPTGAGATVALFALQAGGRVPAMLNFTAGATALQGACRTAGLRRVITARRFVEAANLHETVAGLRAVADVVYLEDLAGAIGRWGRIAALLRARLLPGRWLARRQPQADAAAVILFTSGSEGAPKGVVLTHRNILANIHQVAARVPFQEDDVVFNPLPVFHAFGLTGGLLLPLVYGVRTILYPSPLHSRTIVELAYDLSATVLFGTDTFLAAYGRAAGPYDFHRLRLVFAGAERVKDETRALWLDKFGLRLLEGYGLTETAPVAAVNTPLHLLPGSVGRLVPGIQARLEPVAGIDAGGRLYLKGPNVMAGYLLPDGDGCPAAPQDGWHDTGDVVIIDADGFVTIAGRVKRFAKIAGEMVSLTAVEALAGAAWPDHRHAAVARPDGRKGEQIVLATDCPDADRDRLIALARAGGLADLTVPRSIVRLPTIPVLGTGKTDYAGVARAVATPPDSAPTVQTAGPVRSPRRVSPAAAVA
ncbi:MAG: acyl-[ACP]--phospholipid O-acyltransferase [Rhodospirillaceae bacterium]|nr:acyl-[ACP]--phospholipid O-acyltransferase [Rhodospirillaceae bacterium]